MIQSILRTIEELSVMTTSRFSDIVVDERMLVLYFLIITACIYIASFVFKAIGLYTIAKREGRKHAYLAFIPFASYYLMGKIVGGTKVFGYRVKNLGLVTMIAMILNYALSITYDVLLYGDVIVEFAKTGVLGVIPETYGNVWVDVVLALSNALVGLALIIAEVFLIMTFFMYYGKKNQILFSLLSIFIEPVFGILVFVVRKRERFNYSQYMKMRFDSYTANRSGGGFNNPSEPFVSHNSTPDPYSDYDVKTHKKEEDIDVFEDYSDKRNDT